MPGNADVELPDLLAEVNARISEYAASADVGGVTWEFVCECGETDCALAVPLTADVYDELRALNLALLAPGHPRTRARTLREQASALRLEALAFRNQARHQQKRAARIAAGHAPLTDESSLLGPSNPV